MTRTALKSEASRLDGRYTEFYLARDPEMAWPNEYVVRVFLGRYPNLDLGRDYAGKKILDMGMGDGRNLRFLAGLGMRAFGVEVSDEICDRVRIAFERLGIEADLRRGKNHEIPFADRSFDYLLSWNSSYYMGEERDHYLYPTYAGEFRRVLKPGGTLVLSVPMKSNFIYENSRRTASGYRKILRDPYGIRSGEIFRIFESRDDLIGEFREGFDRFAYASLVDDCFGQRNHYQILVCRRK